MPTRGVRSHFSAFVICAACIVSGKLPGQEPADATGTAAESLPVIARPDLFQPLTEPPCSYCVNQNLKGLVKPDDMVLAWVRGAHNGGAFPLRHFIAAPRVINDTYGLFFLDADGGYVSAFEKDYGFAFHGWRGGVMVVKGPDGSLWSALTGVAFEGPKTGTRMNRVPNLTTTWGHWLMLHPESTAYDLFDGEKYPQAEVPDGPSEDALAGIGDLDDRLARDAMVMGIEGPETQLAVPLDGLAERDVRSVEIDGQPVAVFWYAPTKSAVAWSPVVEGQTLTFYPDGISPETAPFKDRETGTRWTLAGRGVDGPLRGRELDWIPSIQCRWYSWSTEYPHTTIAK